jgi:hypothetical protein
MRLGMRLTAIVGATVVIGTSAVVAARRFWVPRDVQAAPPARVGWRYPNEQSWLVGETLGHLSGLAHFARSGRPAPAGAVDFTVQDRRPLLPSQLVLEATRRDGSGERVEVTVTDHVFSPEAFRPVAARWLAGAKATSAAPSSDVVERLADLRMDVLIETSQQASRTLTREPRSAEAHEDAAFVLAAFGLREASAGHTDLRRILTRTAAHLALARALRGGAPASPAGRLAAIALSSMAGRQAEAAAAIDALPAPGPRGQAAWAAALRLFATQDWRRTAWSGDLSLVEQIAWFRAANARRSGDRAYVWLESLPPSRRGLPDWGRLRLTGNPTVRDCQVFAIGGAVHDLAEGRQAAELFGMGALDDAALLSALNAPALLDPVTGGADPRIQVLDWGTVAAFVQRHLGARLSYEAHCHQSVLGLPDQTEPVVLAQEASYGALTLFPLEAQRWVKTPGTRRRLAEQGARLLRERPDIVAPHLWCRMLDPALAGFPSDLPKDTAWFDPPYPFGTLLSETTRLYGPSPGRTVGAEAFEAAIRLDPFDTRLRWALVRRKHGAEPSYEALKEGYGPSLEWDVRSMNSLAWLSSTPAPEKRRWLTRVCEEDADYCGSLGKFLADAREDAAAVEAYRKYRKGATDRVAVSNSMRWLVDHLRTHGREAEAWEVARESAATYSGEGLLTLADLAEKVGRLDEAHEQYRLVAERYAQPEVLYQFYSRRVDAGDAAYERDRKGVLERVFPRGFEPLDEPPSGPPTDGVVVTTIRPESERAGFRKDDIVVALDGTRVRNQSQLSIVRMRGTDPEMRFLLYRAGAYIPVTARFEGRRLPAGTASYPAPR